MIDFFFINKILILLVNTIGVWLALWVYFANPKAKLNKLFTLMIVLALSWITLCYLSGISVSNLRLSIFLGKLAYGITALFLIPFYFFFSSFMGEEKKFPLLNIFVPLGGVFLFFLSVFTNLMAKFMVPAKFGVVPVLGDGKMVYFGIASFVALFIIGRLFIKYSKALKSEKLKLQYFLIGISIFIIINFFFNVILPSYQGIPYYYYLGNYSIIFLLGFTAYAIVKRELFGIKVVLTSLLIGLIGLVLALQILIAPNTLWRVINIIIFLLFCLFGYYLLRAVQQEEKRREEAELLAVREMALRLKAEKLATEFKQLDEAKTQFMMTTQHHLRTPLTVIQGYLSMILEGSYGKISDIAKLKIKNALVATQRLIKLANDFLDVAQFEVGKEVMTKKEVQVEEVLEEVVNELKDEAKIKNLYLKLEPIRQSSAFVPLSGTKAEKQDKHALPLVMADREKLKEAIYNLVFNGIKYTEHGGVTIKLKVQNSKFKAPDDDGTLTGKENQEIRTNGNILIEISDTGIGMEPEEIAGLFAKTFERGEQAKKIYTTGRGIGLYLANQIIRAHGGRLWAESEGRGKGSRFYVELPVKE
jgi:signal transduction histidine kinase